jgi:agmatinase
MTFDPNAPAPRDAGIFGLDFSEANAALVLLPIPWEATTSYGGGTSMGPAAIFKASKQVDLFDLQVERPYEAGIAMLPESAAIQALNTEAKALAQEVIVNFEDLVEARRSELLSAVNMRSHKVNAAVRNETARLLKAGKVVGIVGGDHSVPFGAFQAAAAHFGNFGILHFDAHSDTRNTYEGFEHSHASIMHNACMHIPKIERLVQVGIRDTCEQEMRFVAAQGERVAMFSDSALNGRKFRGDSWSLTCAQIVSKLPQQVWVSFDIDGLDPRFCPHTGTPVPGGLDFAEAVFLIAEVVRAGKRIIGFDLCEVAPNGTDDTDEWDGNVGARLLYKLCSLTLASQGLATLRATSL